MSNLEKSITASFNYASKTAELNLFEIAAIVGGAPDAVRTHKGSMPEVLWEGFFGMFEGPEILRRHEAGQSLTLSGITASVQKSRNSLLGIPWGSSDKYNYLQSERAGKTLTALSAYTTKLDTAERQQTPRIELPYAGPLGDNSSRPGLIRQPFGVAQVVAQALPHQSGPTYRPNAEDALFFSGKLTLLGEQGFSLPQVMLGQTAVVSEIMDSTVAVQALETAYGGSAAAISEVWGQAMALPTPRQAAEHIMAEL